MRRCHRSCVLRRHSYRKRYLRRRSTICGLAHWRHSNNLPKQLRYHRSCGPNRLGNFRNQYRRDWSTIDLRHSVHHHKRNTWYCHHNRNYPKLIQHHYSCEPRRRIRRRKLERCRSYPVAGHLRAVRMRPQHCHRNGNYPKQRRF